MGKMAHKMLEKNTGVFYEEDVKEHSLKLTEVTVLSGLCTELPASSSGRRTFCFIHFTFQVELCLKYYYNIIMKLATYVGMLTSIYSTFRSENK